MIDPRTRTLSIAKCSGSQRLAASDHVAVEEPLEIRVAFGAPDARTVKPISITMRTPGANPAEDIELALGFLISEGIVRSAGDVERGYHCGPETAPLRLRNVVRVELSPALPVDLSRLERHFYTTSSCGVCGKTTLEAIKTVCPSSLQDHFVIDAATIHALPELLRAAQSVFDSTGGLHAAALFDHRGKLIVLREDVGRHNALDKLIGSQFLAGSLPLSNCVLLLSGRASFELLQKAAMAGIPVVAAVGAPSSLAVDLAQQFNITLLGFVRNNRFNIYAGEQRIILSAQTGVSDSGSQCATSNAGTSHA